MNKIENFEIRAGSESMLCQVIVEPEAKGKISNINPACI